MKVNIHQAKTHFSKLLQRVAGGEEITIARSGVPVARLIRAEPSKAIRSMGMDRDAIDIADDFDAELPAALLAQFHAENAATSKRVKKGKRRQA